MDAAMHAERALLGAMLTDLRARRGILRIISPEDFCRPWHGQVFAAMQRISARDGACGPLEVYAELQRDPDLPRSVSHDAVPLADLLHLTPGSSHAPAYAGIVIGAAIRRGLVVGGGQLRQAAEASGEPVDDRALEAARYVVARVRRGAGAARRRWERLPVLVRRELPASARDSGQNAEAAWRAGRIRDELARIRQDLWADDKALVAERLAAIASQLAGDAAKSADRPGGEPEPAAVTGRPEGAAAVAAGLAAVRDLIADPDYVSSLAGWLQPGHFAEPGHGVLFGVIADLSREQMPVDPVTVSWEAARRGVLVEPGQLAGGCGAFAAGSTVQVYRRAALARVQHAGLEIQASADDARLPVTTVLQRAGEKLAAVDRDLAPELCQWPRQAQVVPLAGRDVRRGRARQAGSRTGWEAAR
jgi:replicative DNA helicase